MLVTFVIVPACAAQFAACGAGDGKPADTATDTATQVAGADSAAASPAAPAESACAPAPMSDSAAGPVRLGMTVESLRARCPGTRDSTGLGDEGATTRSLLVPVAGETIDASIVAGRVWRIAVTSPGVRTADSLGVGTPLSRLLALPGARGIAGEGRAFVVADRPCGLSFQLDVDRALAAGEIGRLPGGTRVKRVLVTGCGP